MNKLFGFFLIFSIIFGMFGGAFGIKYSDVNFISISAKDSNYPLDYKFEKGEWKFKSGLDTNYRQLGDLRTRTMSSYIPTFPITYNYPYGQSQYDLLNSLKNKNKVNGIKYLNKLGSKNIYKSISFVTNTDVNINSRGTLASSTLFSSTSTASQPTPPTIAPPTTKPTTSSTVPQSTPSPIAPSPQIANLNDIAQNALDNGVNNFKFKGKTYTFSNDRQTYFISVVVDNMPRIKTYKLTDGTIENKLTPDSVKLLLDLYSNKYPTGTQIPTLSLAQHNKLDATGKLVYDYKLNGNVEAIISSSDSIKLLFLDNQEIRNSIDTTNLNLVQKKFVLSSVYSDLSTNILNDASNSDIKDLCSGNLNSKCISSMVKDSVLTARLPTLIDSESILVDSNTIALILADPTISQEIKDKLQSSFLKKDCTGSINPFCEFTSKINQREAYINNLNSQIEIAKLNGLNIGDNGESIKINGEDVICGSTCYEVILANCDGAKSCINNGISQLKQKAKTVDYNTINNIAFEVYLKQAGFDGNSEITNSCSNGLDSICKTVIKSACETAGKGNCADILAGFSVLRDQQLVQTNAFFDTINALANPDFDALNAAKLFGFEPNYNNVPKMLRTPFASQICSAKISGYLDKDLTNSGGGITSYGCDKAITENYDVNTGIYVNSDANCLKVLLDFRAQRAQITPDNKVSITYSLYLKAPPKINIKYFLAIKYLLKDKTTKKQLLKPNKNVFEFTGIGGVSKQYDTVDVNLNISKNLIEDSKTSFSLSILARYPDGRIYQHKTIPIILISATDSYVGILAGNGVSSGAINSVGAGASLSPAPLTPADMLGMI